jgi:hypothetical protein
MFHTELWCWTSEKLAARTMHTVSSRCLGNSGGAGLNSSGIAALPLPVDLLSPDQAGMRILDEPRSDPFVTARLRVRRIYELLFAGLGGLIR